MGTMTKASIRPLALAAIAGMLALAMQAACAQAPEGAEAAGAPIANPAIDPQAYLRVADQAVRHRAGRRLSEAEFIRMSGEPGVVVLDARSKQKFDELHVAGAINLSFPDIAFDTLAAALPDKATRILIYCNNNFAGAEGPFPSKLPSASLNLATYTTLYDYGYRDVWELGPLIDVAATALVFAGSAAAQR